MCCMRLAGNTGCKNDAKNRHLCTITQLWRAESSQLRHVSTIGKRLLNSNLLHTSPQYSELRPTCGWDRFGSLLHPSKFWPVSRLFFVTAVTSVTGGQPNFARCLAVSWAAILYIHIRHMQNSLCVQVLRSFILAYHYIFTLWVVSICLSFFFFFLA